MQSEQGIGTGKGWVTALIILAVMDFLAALWMVGVARLAGWPVVSEENPYWFETGGLSGLWLLGALILRFVTLVVMAQWTRRLNLPPGQTSAAQDWFVPGVSLFSPVQTLLAANKTGSRTPPWRQVLILAWWLARWPTCGSGFLVVALALTGLLPRTTEEDANTGIIILGWLAIVALVAKPLEIAVVALTNHHQTRRPDLAADHF